MLGCLLKDSSVLNLIDTTSMQTTTADTDFPVIERVIKRSFFSILFQLISLVDFVYILNWSPVIFAAFRDDSALLSFDWHPATHNRVLTINSNNNIRDQLVFEQITVVSLTSYDSTQHSIHPLNLVNFRVFV